MYIERNETPFFFIFNLKYLYLYLRSCPTTKMREFKGSMYCSVLTVCPGVTSMLGTPTNVKSRSVCVWFLLKSKTCFLILRRDLLDSLNLRLNLLSLAYKPCNTTCHFNRELDPFSGSGAQYASHYLIHIYISPIINCKTLYRRNVTIVGKTRR
jgi:hypothetical protein